MNTHLVLTVVRYTVLGQLLGLSAALVLTITGLDLLASVHDTISWSGRRMQRFLQFRLVLTAAGRFSRYRHVSK